MAQTIVPGRAAAAAAPPIAAAAARNVKHTGGATAQVSSASAGAAAGRQDTSPALIAAPAYSVGTDRACQPNFSLAAAVVLSGPAATPSAKLAVDSSPVAAAPVPVAAAGPGRSIYAQAVNNIQPICGKAAEGIQEQEGGRGCALGAAVALEGGCRPLQPAAAEDL